MQKTFALAGNPNVGKSALFNALTGLHQIIGNYPGVTVTRKHGRLDLPSGSVELVDVPGAYSLAARSPDELVVADILLNQQPGEKPIDGIIAVLDASNLERNLYFCSQLLELGKPVVVALNMMDIAERRGLQIDAQALSVRLGAPVIPICAHKRRGLAELWAALDDLAQGNIAPATAPACLDERFRGVVAAFATALNEHQEALGWTVQRPEAQRILADEGGYFESRVLDKLGHPYLETINEYRAQARDAATGFAVVEARGRYGWTREVVGETVERGPHGFRSKSERLDDILTHKVWGTAIFFFTMLVLFQAIFSWAGPVMDAIEGVFGALGEVAAAFLPEGALQSLVVDGVIAGVGGVLVFLPQIALLSLFIAILEDFGYMSRAAFLMDKLLSWCGLSGQSFIPMLSSFACAIPGIMATRVIPDRRDRFTTILVAPLMSCSARLPVYIIMIEAFLPGKTYLGGWLNLQGLVLLGMYCLGVVVAVPVAYILKKTFFHGKRPPFIMELPSYKTPQAGNVGRKVYYEAREFLVRAGTLILAVTIVIWALAYFPRSGEIAAEFEAQRQVVLVEVQDEALQEERLAELDNAEQGAQLRNSLLGRFGQAVEPVFVPLGWDWRIATATIASFPAREVIIATLGTLFNLGADMDEESPGLRETLRQATWPDGRPLFNIPVALSIMVFFALCCQCAATLMVMKRETGQWRWPVLTFVYMTVLAYIGAFVTYQGAMLVGLGKIT